jgi:tRNA U38,U39,U40 pseudouridine synthase TruA
LNYQQRLIEALAPELGEKGTEMSNTTQQVQVATKGNKIVLEQVRQLVEVRAEIARLEKLKVALTEEVEKAFGVDKKAKTSTATTLTHNAIEFARLDWRSRKGIDSEKLAEKFPEAYEACQKPTVYSVIVSLFK